MSMIPKKSWFYFKNNIKRVKFALTKWSTETYGDFFKQLTIKENIVKIKEKLFEESPNAENKEVLQRAHVEYKRYLHFEEIFWNKRLGMTGLRVVIKILGSFTML